MRISDYSLQRWVKFGENANNQILIRNKKNVTRKNKNISLSFTSHHFLE